MSHTNSTPNFNLPQFVANDTPAWLTDINGAFSDIDTNMASIQNIANTASGTATGASTKADQLDAELDTTNSNVSTVQANLASVTTRVGTLETEYTTVSGDLNTLTSQVEQNTHDISTLEQVQGIATYTHVLQGTIHTLAGDGENGQFFATANYNEGDTFMVNGTVKTVVYQIGGNLPNEYFVTGACVRFVVSGNNIYFF